MSLSQEDLQAIAGLITPLEARMEAGFTEVTGHLYQIDNRLDKIEVRLDDVEMRLDKLEIDTAALKAGQLSLKKDIKVLEQKVQDSYELALEAWGKSTENRFMLQEL